VPVSHVIYGLRLTANLAIPGIPSAQDDRNAFDLTIHLKETPAFPPMRHLQAEFFHTSYGTDSREQPILRVGVLQGGEFFVFFYSDGARFVVQHQGREVWADWPDDYALEDACTYLLGPVMGFVLRLRGITCLHASAVRIGNYAIALTSFPGAGKSTLAAAFGCAGFPVLSDDIVALKDEGQRFLVQPGYPRVNLWPDSVRALFGSENALPRITPTWDKRYLALDQNGYRFSSQPLPLRAVYVLAAREAALRNALVEEFVGGQAFMALVANTYLNSLLDRDMRTREFDVLSRVVAGVPIRRVHPTNDTMVVSDLRDAIATDARRLTTTADEPMTATR
jgi:hypothetical protein